MMTRIHFLLMPIICFLSYAALWHRTDLWTILGAGSGVGNGDHSVRGMQQSTFHRRHGAYGRQGKMLYYDLRPHSSVSALKTHIGKTLWLMEIRLGTREGMIAQVVTAADDIGVHALNMHGDHRPGNQDAGTPGQLPL